LGELEREAITDVLLEKTRLWSMAAAAGSTQAAGTRLKEAEKMFLAAASAIMPWRSWDQDDFYRKEGDLQLDMYRRTFGDPTDPEVAGELARLKSMWQNTAAQTATSAAAETKRAAAGFAQQQHKMTQRKQNWKAAIEAGDV
jgi:hypothetical protein